jgi:serine O-acetyltransferase
MPRTLAEWIVGDLARFRGPAIVTLVKQPQSRWLVRLRITEWWIRTGMPLRILLRAWTQSSGVKLGYTIPPGTVGYGVRLPHWGTIVISGGASVGENCQILHGVTLGDNNYGAPTIGDNVFIGPNVTVMGPVTVGSGAVLVANAVVTHDVPAGETWGGIPARKLGRGS